MSGETRISFSKTAYEAQEAARRASSTPPLPPEVRAAIHDNVREVFNATSARDDALMNIIATPTSASGEVRDAAVAKHEAAQRAVAALGEKANIFKFGRKP